MANTVVRVKLLLGTTTGYRKTLMTSRHCQRVFNSRPSLNSHGVDCSISGRCSFSSTSGGTVRREYDYVVIGAGSAGCVVANRLVLGDKAANVLVAEAGPAADRSWKVRMPAALMYCLKNPRYSWCYETVPQKHMDNRPFFWPRGKLLGGSSSINAMIYVRGNPADYDRWAFQEGATGWSYADCLPYFIKSQSHELGANEFRGDAGCLQVSRGRSQNPLHDAFIDAGHQAGYPITDDFNGAQQEGFGRYDLTISHGKRSSTAAMYLRPAMKQAGSRLTVLTDTLVTRVLFDGRRAVGIEFQTGGRQQPVHKIFAKEIILCGGAINSPQLLMLSGIGPSQELRRHGIQVVHHSPGVGRNLQDHIEVYVQHHCTKPITLYQHQWRFPLTMIRTGLQWFLTSSGDAATSHLESGAFVRSRPEVEYPDIQFHFLPSVVIDHGQKMASCHSFQAHVGTMRETSRGTLHLQSADPTQPPIIDPNYLSTADDVQDMRACVRIARQVFSQRAFDQYRGEEMLPGIDCRTDQQLDAFIRANAETAYHPSCTCRMGSSERDENVVVDPSCRVVGVEGLRVVDASVMPSIVTGNLNGPVIMMAEKASDIILKAYNK